MAANTQPVFTDTVVRGSARFLPADTTTVKTVLTAGTDGTRIDYLLISSSSSAAEAVTIYLNDGTYDIPIATVEVPIGAGTLTTETAVNVLDPAVCPFVTADRRLYLKGGDLIRASVDTVTDNVLYVVAIGGDF